MKTEEEEFPVGMRVLVVDDDPTCLKLLKSLLHKCHYHVTTTNKAKEALRMLKENKKMFDIVISDVQMPDMDGLKLLHLLGLIEMDLPVIMLSAYDDTKLVMKGIKNGACDYLLKPVRIQELQNIWQHVVRRNKSLTLPRPHESVRTLTPAAKEDGRLERKSIIKEKANHDDEELEESGRENEDPTTQKGSRLFWSVELHQKFVDAVNQLGLDNAFPKKILDLMNVEGLTREKVASHLQKYRLYLRKNAALSGPANGVGVLGAQDTHIGSLGGGYGVYRTLAGPGRLLGATSSLSHQVSGMLGRLNSATGLSMRGPSSSTMLLQQSQPRNSNSSLTNRGNLEPFRLPANQNASLLQALPQNKAPLLCPSTNSLMLNGSPPYNTRGLDAQSSLEVASSNIGTLESVAVNAANLLDPNRSTTNNSGCSVQSCVRPHSDFQHNQFLCNVSGNSISHSSAQQQKVQSDPLGYFCGISSLEDSRGDVQNQDNSSIVGSLNYLEQSQSWQDHGTDYILDTCNRSGTAVGSSDQSLSQGNNKVGSSPFSQLGGVAASHFLQQDEVQISNGDTNVRFDGSYVLDETNLLGGSSCESLEDIVERFLKQGNGEMEPAGEDFCHDLFPV